MSGWEIEIDALKARLCEVTEENEALLRERSEKEERCYDLMRLINRGDSLHSGASSGPQSLPICLKAVKNVKNEHIISA